MKSTCTSGTRGETFRRLLARSRAARFVRPVRELARRLEHVHACPWEPEDFVFAARFLSVFYQMLGFLTKSSHCNDFVEKPNCLRVLPAISGNHDTERQL